MKNRGFRLTVLAFALLAGAVHAGELRSYTAPDGSIYLGRNPPAGSVLGKTYSASDPAAAPTPGPATRFIRSIFPKQIEDVGTVRVVSTWREYGAVKTLVSYRNTTDTTFRAVSIDCTASYLGTQVGTAGRSFFETVEPRFRGQLEVPIYPAGDSPVDRVVCSGHGTAKTS